MATETREKRCNVCGTDVSQAKRTKDTAGNYYCEPCVHTARQRSYPANGVKKGCANCGIEVGALQQLWDWNGHKVCSACGDSLRHDAELRQAEQKQAVTADIQKVEKRQDVSRSVLHAERAKQRAILFAGLSTVVGVIALTSATFAVDQMYRWAAIGLGTGMLISGITQISKYRQMTIGSMANAKADLIAGLCLLLGRWRKIAEGILYFVLCIVPFMGMAIGSDTRVTAIGGFGIGVAITIVLAFVFRRYMATNECPHCWTQGTAVFDGIEDLGVQAITTKTFENATVHDGYNTFGPPLATIKVPVEKTRYVRRQARHWHWHCTACGHLWKK